MKQILKLCVLTLMILALILPAAQAEEIVISERVKATRLADKALEEKYGITLLGQEYFDRDTTDKEGGAYIVRYMGADFLGYVLGTYKVVVENSAVTGITWSFDGEDTSGGLGAEAWGSEQIYELLRLNQETGDTSLFSGRVEKINQKHGFVPDRDAVNDTTLVMHETRSEEVRDQAVLSVEQVNEIAKQALVELYELTDEQAAQMEVLSEPDEEAYWYVTYHDIPCLICCIGLEDYEAEPDVLPDGIIYTEKNGSYFVCVNVLDGTVESVSYAVGIGGNG
ncbi:MAG: hypothetical protein IKS46_02305 [Clostridia bacterium]|nr:hypothetical protein [Clostridia bacterium]